ncbi:MAG: hypothetical protein Q8Q23_04375 [bacterium]|nr:hypothetical protein [bacterium]
MQLEKWQQIVGMVKDQFGVDEEGEGTVEDVPNSKIDFIIFQGPLGKMRLEYITKPILLDKKTIGSRRIGSETAVDYIYSEDEFSNTFKAYKLDEDSGKWAEMEAEAAGAFSV